jgi:hypothetical protein
LAAVVKHSALAPPLEIIEIIDDDHPLDHHGAVLQTPPERGPRWVGFAATAALLAAITYGVISSAIATNSANNAASATTTLAPTTTVAQVAAVHLIAPQFYVTDNIPSGFTMHFAESLGMGGNSADFTDSSTAQLWATDDATATSGYWFVVSRGTHHSTGRNAYRTIVAGVPVVVEHDANSHQSRLAFTKNGEQLEITAFGWADRQLLRLVQSVYLGDSEIRFDDHFFTSDHHKVLDADPTSAVYGLPVAWVGYTTAVPAALARSFTITVAGYNAVQRDAALPFALFNIEPIEIGASPGVIGQLAADPRQTVIQWQDGERLITLRGNLDVPTLVSIADGTHPEDSAVVRQQVDTNPTPSPILQGDRHPVASGWLDGPWFVQVSSGPGDDNTEWYVWWIGQPAATSTPSESRLSLTGYGPSIETFVDHGKTYVLAKVPRALGSAQLQVNLNGLPSTKVAFVDAGDNFPAEFAAFAFTEAVPFTAQIVVAGGTAASWPTE